MRVSHGFSLVELITAMSVAAILIGIGVPGFLSLIKNTRLDSATSLLSGDLSRARNEAIRRGRQINACVADGLHQTLGTCGDGDWANGWVIYEDSNEDGVLNAGEEVIVENMSKLKNAVTFIDISENPVSMLSFSSRGIPSNSGAFHICDHDAEINRKLTLSLSGRASVNENLASCE